MVGIVFIGDILLCPYLKKYTEICDEKKIEYQVLFWNRSGETMEYPHNYLYFDYKSKLKQNKFIKLFHFYKFKKWAQRTIKKNNYDKLIILTTMTGIILSKILKKYKKKYIFDIRDYCWENTRLFYKIEKRIIENSYFSCISSLGFKSFLPKYDYLIVHNAQSEFFNIEKSFKKKKYGESLNVVWTGLVRYFEYQSKILYKLKNDKRFNIIYHGIGTDMDKYKAFCRKYSISNVHFAGKYDNKEKPFLLASADLLNNAYWEDKEKNAVIYAISNKYYDGLIFKIPQIVEAGTYKTRICKNNEIGFSVDINDDDLANKLYDWYFSIDETKFNLSCNELLEIVKKETEIYEKNIVQFLAN